MIKVFKQKYLKYSYEVYFTYLIKVRYSELYVKFQ